jgi:hypothetical protein
MLSMRRTGRIAFALIFLAAFGCLVSRAQAALLMEEPYGFFGILTPTGHDAIYFERICAESPTQLRRCGPGEMGAVIARYQGIDGLDWVAIPLIPYLYSVENASDVPDRVNHEIVNRLRNRYREAHLESLGLDLSAGNLVHGGWTQLVGVAYERRIYAFRFTTTAAQDDALIARLNTEPNQSAFNLPFSNCADFARVILNSYFPHTFRRSIFPDAGMTTPKQVAYKLVRYARKHKDPQFAIFEIPQIPGYRRQSHAIKNIDESFVTTVYAIPITILNPYVTGGLMVDYLVRGRYHLLPKHLQVLGPDDFAPLTYLGVSVENPAIAGAQVPSAIPLVPAAIRVAAGAESGLIEIKAKQ